MLMTLYFVIKQFVLLLFLSLCFSNNNFLLLFKIKNSFFNSEYISLFILFVYIVPITINIDEIKNVNKYGPSFLVDKINIK